MSGIELGALFVTLRRFSSLPTERAVRYLNSWAKSRIFYFRIALRGALTPIKIAHFALPEVSKILGYDPPPPAPPEPLGPWGDNITPAADRAGETLRCDVVVIGQRDPDTREIAGPNHMPDHVLLSAGRPVLVVPHVGTYPSVGKRVMVAWDGSLPAARAVNDALPILRGAEKVNVITVYRHDVSADAGREPGERICRHLARHGIAARSQHFRANGIGTGDLILSRAADEGTDLIVMGAYGHARWRELVLGGVTLHMLKHMTVPVLMFH